MKKYILILLAILFTGCANSTSVEFDDSDQVTVCGEVAGDKQTYPTIGDLKNDGAKLLYYGPCY